MSSIYPSTWFAANLGKPSITCTVGDAARKYHDIQVMVNENHWNDITVTSFMTSVIQENPLIFQQVSPDAWISHERVIATANQKVTPLDILDIVEGERLEAVQQPIISTQKSRLSTFFGLLLIYRKTLAKTVNKTYGLKVGRKLNNIFQGHLNMDPVEEKRFAPYVGRGKLTTNYRKLIAAIDMFLFRFPNSGYVKIRMATLPARYRGCTALVSLSQIARITGLEQNELSLFVFTDPVGEEFLQICKKDEGARDRHGYFPYQLEFDLTARSPYSLSANPNLYLWLHTIGSLIGFSRSINAKMPSGVTKLVETIDSAAVVALNLVGLGTYSRQFCESAEVAAAYRKREEQARVAEQERLQKSINAKIVETINLATAVSLNLTDGANYKKFFTQSAEAATAYRKQKEQSRIAEQDNDEESQNNILASILMKPIEIKANALLMKLICNSGITEAEIDLIRQKLQCCKNARPYTIGACLKTLFTASCKADKKLCFLKRNKSRIMTNAAQKTPISLLQELCAQQGMTPDYKLMSVEGAVHAPTFMYRVQVNDVMATATGQSKKKAKHAAAKAVLERLLGQDGKFNEGFTSDGVMVNAETLNEVIAEAVAPPPPEESTEDNPVGKLQEHCMKERWQPPYYETENATGLPHEKIFTMMCFVDSFTTTGEGKSKRLAKRQAAAKMLERLNSMKKVSADEEEQAKANVNEDSTVTKNLAVVDDKDRTNPCVVNDDNSDSQKHSDNGDFTTTNIMIMSSIKVSKPDLAVDDGKFESSAFNKILDSTEPHSDSQKHADNGEFHFNRYNDHEFNQGSKSDFAADSKKFESSTTNKILDSSEPSNDKISDELITGISSVQVSELAVVDEKEKQNPSLIDKNALLSKLRNHNIVKTDSVVKDPIQSSTT